MECFRKKKLGLGLANSWSNDYLHSMGHCKYWTMTRQGEKRCVYCGYLLCSECITNDSELFKAVGPEVLKRSDPKNNKSSKTDYNTQCCYACQNFLEKANGD